MTEYEFYPFRFYRHSEGWFMACGELVNHTSGGIWALLALGWSREEGWSLRICR